MQSCLLLKTRQRNARYRFEEIRHDLSQLTSLLLVVSLPPLALLRARPLARPVVMLGPTVLGPFGPVTRPWLTALRPLVRSSPLLKVTISMLDRFLVQFRTLLQHGQVALPGPKAARQALANPSRPRLKLLTLRIYTNATCYNELTASRPRQTPDALGAPDTKRPVGRPVLVPPFP